MMGRTSYEFLLSLFIPYRAKRRPLLRLGSTGRPAARSVARDCLQDPNGCDSRTPANQESNTIPCRNVSNELQTAFHKLSTGLSTPNGFSAESASGTLDAAVWRQSSP